MVSGGGVIRPYEPNHRHNTNLYNLISLRSKHSLSGLATIESNLMTKYKLTNNKIELFGKTLFQTEALISFGNIGKGEKGGNISKEESLNRGYKE